MITEIVEKNKLKQLRGLNNQKTSLGSSESNDKFITNTNAELGKIARVSKATVQRARRIKKENPEAYERVVKGESSWRAEYDNKRIDRI
ncbi:hypothetical protein [Aliicoccus persicus]|uniref:hypothetical protein n=1 Tax=Aliicoccus persicus TaxID=930138 RepID=UPI0011776CD8|nr:hypothetical protein [Aliicoccus persicus]